jgi:WD40 repeat protein
MSQMAVSPHDEISPPTPTFVTKVLGEPRFHTETDIAAISFTSQGTIWSIDEAGILRHWSADGSCLARHFLSDLETLWCFDRQAKLLASANDDLLIWNVEDGQLLHRIAQPNWVTAIAFSPDSRVVVTGHDDGKIRFWDALGQKLIGEINAYEEPISAIAFSPDNNSIVTASENRVIKVWHAESHKLMGQYVSHTDRIPSLSWSADSSLFASAGWDTSARVWKAGVNDPLILLNSHSDQVLSVAFSPLGHVLATADSDCDIHLWSEPTQGKVVHVLRGHADEIRALAFSHDGTKLASAGADRVIHVWDVYTGALLAGPNPSGRFALTTYQTEKSEEVAFATDSVLQIWDAKAGQSQLKETISANCVASSADGKLLAVGGTDHNTKLYERGKFLRALEATKPPIGSVAFSPDGSMLAHTSPTDGLVWLWSTASDSGDAKLILIEAADGCTLESLAYHPDGNQLAVGGIDYLSTGDRDGAVAIWDLTTKEKNQVFDYGVYSVAFDPKGRYLTGAGVTNFVYVWDLQSNELAFELEGHQSKVHTSIFDPEGSYVLSGGDDGTLRVWDVLSGRLMVVREFDVPVQALAFGKSGSLYVGLGNTTCLVVDFNKLIND